MGLADGHATVQHAILGVFGASVLMTVCWRTIPDDGKLGLWEVAAGGEYRTLVRAAAAGKGYYDHPAIRSDGRLLAVGMRDGVGLWDLHSGKELAFLESPGTYFCLV